jgi:quinol-cytochrome oxidoreductase complex cytochrome b subunit
LLKYIPKVAGVVLPILGVLFVIVWPFLRRRVDTSRRGITVRAIAVGVAVVVFIVMTIWGEVS